LDASAAGDTKSAGVLTRLVSELPRGLTRSSIPKPRPPPEPPKDRFASLPPERAVLNVRPYAQTSGPRHVPIMASANGVPFLRLTKPQPLALSRMLRHRLERKQKIFDTRIMLLNWSLPMARQEDMWDTIIGEYCGRSIEGNTSVKWVDAVHSSERENQHAYEADLANDKAIIKRMQSIVDQETKLALQEGQTIFRGRTRRPIRVTKPEVSGASRL